MLYVEGWNGNRARAHKGGLFGFLTWNLDPKSPRLMADNLRPLTDTGIGYLLKTVAGNVRRAIQADEAVFVERGEEIVYGRKTRTFEILFPKDKSKGYDAQRLILHQDIANKILIDVTMYGWDGQLLSRYGYANLRLNAGLTDFDFDPKNPEYHF